MKNSTPITKEQYIKAKLLDSPLFFTRYFFKHQYNRKFVVGEHHKEICRVIKRIITGECTRVIINMPPRYGKTELLVKTLIALGLAVNPRSKFIHTSYSDTLALDNSENVKDVVESEEYQKYFDVNLKKDSKSKKKWYTDQGGGIYAAASGGQITGFGAGQVDIEKDGTEEMDDFINSFDLMEERFSGAIIIDDPIKPEDANSDGTRNKINERFDNTIRSRVNSRNTPIVVVMQRVHEEDLTGYLIGLEPDEWELLEMPAINDNGEALWPFKHTVEELLKLKKANEQVFDSQYQQNPHDKEGVVFDKTEMQFFSLNDLNKQNITGTIGSIDVADEGEDYYSMPCGAKSGRKIYITDWVFSNENTDYTIPQSTAKIRGNKMNYVVIETNNQGSVVMKEIQKQISSGTTLFPKYNTGKKHSRIILNSGFIKENFVFRNDYAPGSEYEKAMKLLFKYRKDGKFKKDDAPDSLALMAEMVSKLYTSEYF